MGPSELEKSLWRSGNHPDILGLPPHLRPLRRQPLSPPTPEIRRLRVPKRLRPKPDLATQKASPTSSSLTTAVINSKGLSKYPAQVDSMPTAHAVRDGGDARPKKQSMADLKLRRYQELASRLKEDLDRPRIMVGEASMSLINFCNQTRDYMIPSVWGQVDRREDPYNPQSGGSDGCCTVM